MQSGTSRVYSNGLPLPQGRQQDPAVLRNVFWSYCSCVSGKPTINQETVVALLFLIQEGYSHHPTSPASTFYQQSVCA